ncbi:MAG: redoxin domain-containing protein [Planctomycetota bacterium]
MNLISNDWTKVAAGVAVLASAAAVATLSATGTTSEAVDQSELVGEAAPDFTLVDTSGTEHTLSDYTADGKIVVLEWFNPMCPFVVKHHDRNTTMADLNAKFSDDGVVWLAINSGHEGHKTTGLSVNREAIEDWDIEYPVLLDYDGTVGRAYGAKTTPNMYIIDADGMLVYAGAIDSDTGASKAGDVNYVDNALTQLIAGETITESFVKPYGCSVKYGRN